MPLPLQARLNDRFIGAFDDATANGIAVGLEAGIDDLVTPFHEASVLSRTVLACGGSVAAAVGSAFRAARMVSGSPATEDRGVLVEPRLGGRCA